MAYDYDTRPHVWSYQAWNQRKTYVFRKKTADFWALDKSVRMVFLPSIKRNSFESLEMYSMVHWDNKGVPLYYVFVWSIWYAMGLQQQYDSIWSFLLFL